MGDLSDFYTSVFTVAQIWSNMQTPAINMGLLFLNFPLISNIVVVSDVSIYLYIYNLLLTLVGWYVSSSSSGPLPEA